MNISDREYEEQLRADKLTRELEKEHPDFDASALWDSLPAINNEQCALMEHLDIDDSYPYKPELPIQIEDNDGILTFSYKERRFIVAASPKIEASDVARSFNGGLWNIKEIF